MRLIGLMLACAVIGAMFVSFGCDSRPHPTTAVKPVTKIGDTVVTKPTEAELLEMQLGISERMVVWPDREPGFFVGSTSLPDVYMGYQGLRLEGKLYLINVSGWMGRKMKRCEITFSVVKHITSPGNPYAALLAAAPNETTTSVQGLPDGGTLHNGDPVSLMDAARELRDRNEFGWLCLGGTRDNGWTYARSQRVPDTHRLFSRGHAASVALRDWPARIQTTEGIVYRALSAPDEGWTHLGRGLDIETTSGLIYVFGPKVNAVSSLRDDFPQMRWFGFRPEGKNWMTPAKRFVVSGVQEVSIGTGKVAEITTVAGGLIQLRIIPAKAPFVGVEAGMPCSVTWNSGKSSLSGHIAGVSKRQSEKVASVIFNYQGAAKPPLEGEVEVTR